MKLLVLFLCSAPLLLSGCLVKESDCCVLKCVDKSTGYGDLKACETLCSNPNAIVDPQSKYSNRTTTKRNWFLKLSPPSQNTLLILRGFFLFFFFYYKNYINEIEVIFFICYPLLFFGVWGQPQNFLQSGRDPSLNTISPSLCRACVKIHRGRRVAHYWSKVLNQESASVNNIP